MYGNAGGVGARALSCPRLLDDEIPAPGLAVAHPTEAERAAVRSVEAWPAAEAGTSA